MWKQISSDSLKIRLPINFWLKKHIYDHLTVCKRISSGSFKKVNHKLCVYKLYICIKRILHKITNNGWYAMKPKQTKPYI